jgi:hypothetical protein
MPDGSQTRERLKTRDEVPYSDKVLEQRTRKYLSRSSEFWTVRPPQWWNITNREPVYPRCSRGSARLAPKPFESGSNVLPGMEDFAER